MENKKNRNQPSTSLDNKDVSDNPKKYAFYRKPSIKKKAPEVKHTRTSMRRMLQANPLMKIEMEGSVPPSRQNSQNNLKKNLAVTNSVTSKKTSTSNSLKPKSDIIRLAGNEPNPNASHMSLNSARLSSLFDTATNKILSSTQLEGNHSSNNKSESKFKLPPAENSKLKFTNKHMSSESYVNKDSSSLRQKVVSNSNTRPSRDRIPRGNKKPLRRSLSAQHFDRKSGITKVQVTETSNSMQAQSLENITADIHQEMPQHKVSPIAEVSQETNLVFKTPSAYERRSVSRFTPHSISLSRRSIYRPSSHLPSLEDLQKRLNDWLIKRGKRITMLPRLKHFNSPIDEENKENVEVNLNKGSYEDLGIDKSDDENSDNVNNGGNENLESVAKGALVDLNHLIREGYPVTHCEGWLELIKTKYSKLQEEPEYWECRAAIEQSRGNLTNAVECYRTAIVQGAEVQEVDKSLDILLQKFSLLNIDTEHRENEKTKRERARIIQDARNVFKSSIIKFAVQEKKLKKNDSELKLVATPVRRSTRLSRSAYTSTPGVKVCSTLRELESPEREKLDFRNNKAFL